MKEIMLFFAFLFIMLFSSYSQHSYKTNLSIGAGEYANYLPPKTSSSFAVLNIKPNLNVSNDYFVDLNKTRLGIGIKYLVFYSDIINSSCNCIGYVNKRNILLYTILFGYKFGAKENYKFVPEIKFGSYYIFDYNNVPKRFMFGINFSNEIKLSKKFVFTITPNFNILQAEYLEYKENNKLIKAPANTYFLLNLNVGMNYTINK